MTKMRKGLATVSILLLVAASFASINWYLNNSVEYQFKLLKSGNVSQKINAISFLSDKRELSIIPFLIANISNADEGHWRKEPKSSYISISCVATFELGELTHNSFGDTCNNGAPTAADKAVTKQKWRDWYKNDYPAWLEQQTKK